MTFSIVTDIQELVVPIIQQHVPKSLPELRQAFGHFINERLRGLLTAQLVKVGDSIEYHVRVGEIFSKKLVPSKKRRRKQITFSVAITADVDVPELPIAEVIDFLGWRKPPTKPPVLSVMPSETTKPNLQVVAG